MSEDKAYVPEISDERLNELSKRIVPVVRKDDKLYNIEIPDLRNAAYTWEVKITNERTDLKEIDQIRTDHYSGHPMLFKPSIAEVLSQIPEKYIDKVCAFEISSIGVDTYSYGNGHQATTILYGLAENCYKMHSNMVDNLEDKKVIDITDKIISRKLNLIGPDMPEIIFTIVPGYYMYDGTKLSTKRVYIEVNGEKTLIFSDTAFNIRGSLHSDSNASFIGALNAICNIHNLYLLQLECYTLFEIDISSIGIKVSAKYTLVNGSGGIITTLTTLDGKPLLSDGRDIKVPLFTLAELCQLLLTEINSK